jgi:hypothetical protein
MRENFRLLQKLSIKLGKNMYSSLTPENFHGEFGEQFHLNFRGFR